MEDTKEIRKFIRCVLKRPSRLPEVIQIEITNRCNLHCPMCPRNRMHLPIKDMAYETFERVVSRIPKADAVILSGWGEPLLHPDFFRMVRLINETLPKTSVRFTTNGVLLDAENRSQIFKRHIARVSVSIDELPLSCSDEDQIGHSGTERVLENVTGFIEERGDRKRPKIWLQSVMQRGGAKKIEDLIEFAGQVGIDSINLVRLDVRNNPDLTRPDWEEERQIIKRAKGAAKRANIRLFCINDRNLAIRLAGHFDTYCLRADHYVYIDVDGNVTPCCSLRDYRCGNLLETPLSEIWVNERFRAFRRDQAKICEDCDAMRYRYADAL